MRGFRWAILILSILLALGGRPALQFVAWTGMLWTYSQEQGLAQGVADTFGGERPCTLCRAIAEQDADDARLQRRGGAELRFEAMAGGGEGPSTGAARVPLIVRSGRPPCSARIDAHAPAPPVPPPRRG